MTKNASVMQSMRLPFLVLSPICVLLAVAIVINNGADFSYFYSFLCLVGALAAHIAVNVINEYQDFTSGLDLKTKRTPFSGGSGLLPSNPHLVDKVFRTSVAAVFTTVLIGCYFIYVYGWQVLPFGLLGLFIVVTYTKWINRSAVLCLIAPGLGFGTLMIAGSYFCITGNYENGMLILTIIPFLLINNLLLLNQFPDIDADKSIGRNHFPIKYGVKASTLVYIIFSVSAQVLLVSLVIMGLLPNLSLLTLLPISLGYISIIGMLKLGKAISCQPKYLAANVACSVLSPLVLSITLLL